MCIISAPSGSNSTSSSQASSPQSSPRSFSPVNPQPIIIVQNVNKDPNWPVKLELPWESMSRDVSVALQNGKRLTPTAKKELVRKTVDAVRLKTEHSTRRQMSVISQRLVAKFTESLQDKIDDTVVGSGYDTILNKLIARNENLNRSGSVNKMCLSNKKRRLEADKSDSTSDDTKRDRSDERKDSYGCVKWHPSVTICMSMIILHHVIETWRK